MVVNSGGGCQKKVCECVARDAMIEFAGLHL